MKWIGASLVFSLLIASIFYSSAESQEVRVISAVDVSYSTISVYEARQIFTGATSHYRGRTIDRVYIQPFNESSTKSFCREVLGMSWPRFRKKIQDLRSSSRGFAPRIVTEYEMVNLIAQYDNSIGYLSEDTLIAIFEGQFKIIKIRYD